MRGQKSLFHLPNIVGENKDKKETRGHRPNQYQQQQQASSSKFNEEKEGDEALILDNEIAVDTVDEMIFCQKMMVMLT